MSKHEPFIRIPVVPILFRVGKAALDFCEPAKTWEEALKIQKVMQEEAELFARARCRREQLNFNPEDVPVIKIFQPAADMWQCVPREPEAE